MPDDGEQGRGEQGRPDYKVYRSRPRLLDRLRSPDVDSLRERPREPGERPSPRVPLPSPGRRRWLKWVLIAIGGWLLLSIVVFAISAQIQQAKLADGAKEELGGNPFLAIDPQTILVIGTDAREQGTLDGSETSEECLEEGANGEAPSETCPGFRADTLMLVRAGGGAFRKLSIPRDSFTEIPGQSAQKINAAYAFGGAGLEIETVEGFLGIDIDHVVIVDFEGFEDFINAIGGVEVELPDRLCSEISGGEANGGFSLNIGPGEVTLDGEEALIFARTRTNACPEEGGSDAFDSYDDLDRAAAQQEVLSGIKGRLTSPRRFPYNFIKGPIIGWTAPQAIISDMGALTMPQLVLAAAAGGDSDPELLEPSGPGPGGGLGLVAPGVLALPLRLLLPLLLPLARPVRRRHLRRLTRVVGGVEAGSLEVHRDGVEDALHGGAALPAARHGVLRHALEDLELVPVAAPVLVDGHGRAIMAGGPDRPAGLRGRSSGAHAGRAAAGPIFGSPFPPSHPAP